MNRIYAGIIVALTLVVSLSITIGWDIASDNNRKGQEYHKAELAACLETGDQTLACIQFVVTAHNGVDRR